LSKTKIIGEKALRIYLQGELIHTATLTVLLEEATFARPWRRFRAPPAMGTMTSLMDVWVG
jgi:hypothetical protein